LSQEDIKSLFGIILELKSKGIAIVYISHFLEEVSAIADRLTVLRDGAAVGTHRISDISNDEIVSLMVGRKVDDLYPRSHRSRGEPMLELTEISGMKKRESDSLVIYCDWLAPAVPS
jgi:ribose transport system ATP-binding protein